MVAPGASETPKGPPPPLPSPEHTAPNTLEPAGLGSPPIIVPKYVKKNSLEDDHQNTIPLWAWYADPLSKCASGAGKAGSITAPLTAPNAPTPTPGDTSIQEAIRHRIFNSVPTAIVTTVVPLGPQSTHMICPHCHAEVDTATKSEPSLIAYLSGFVIALLGCWMGCCLLPCCIPECMNVQHTCPNCRAFLGKYKRG
ncbi:lipopolysaccharide-induced tumor necrosis factor-alpha factor isoform X2 [Oratosquilla oratoria]|uniref:lipopolysaccharide-induced tumor necrosis factor-alpha factor isoform X2 n=1 Tax=Oratosquilla oratoria TaxID=337810 RepID=UPI003F77306E